MGHENKSEIGICGLHYHPSNPFFFFVAFFSNPCSPFEIFNFLLHSFFCNPFMDYGRIIRVHTKIQKLYRHDSNICTSSFLHTYTSCHAHTDLPSVIWLWMHETECILVSTALKLMVFSLTSTFVLASCTKCWWDSKYHSYNSLSQECIQDFLKGDSKQQYEMSKSKALTTWVPSTYGNE